MCVSQVNNQVIHLGAIEQRATARGIGNGEGVLRKGVQSVDIGIWGRDLEGQAGDSRDGDRKSGEGGEGSMNAIEEHHDEGSEDG